MKLNPKILLGTIVLIFALIAVILIFSLKPKNPNSLIIDSDKNEFKVSFQIDKSKSQNFEKLLANLDIPYQIENGLSFKLDATASAYLGLLAPIKADLNISNDQVNFKGNSAKLFLLENLNPEQIRIPTDTTLAIFAPDLTGFIKSRSNLSPDAQKLFIDSTKTTSGHYLIIFGSKPNYALIFKKENLDLSNFKEIPPEASGESAKKENPSENTKFYLLTSDPEAVNSDAGVFFETEKYKVFASSPDAAKEIISAQNSSGKMFPKTKTEDTSLQLEFNNNTDSISDDFISFIFQRGISTIGGKEKVKNFLQKTKEISLSLKGDTFSGLISTK